MALTPAHHDDDRRFGPRHAVAATRRAARAPGVAPGAEAPDFELPQAGGGSLRLSELRGWPVVLRFGSPTCPATIGSVEPLRALHRFWDAQLRMVEIVVRQANPGPGAPAYRRPEDKLADALRYRDARRLPWPVLADEVDARVHLAYGGLPASIYLIDAEGRVAFHGLWAHAPTLHRAIEALLWQGGRGVVLGGTDRRPHLLSALAAGWPALRRSGPVGAVAGAAPGLALALWVGHVLRPLLALLALRAQPLSPPSRVALAAGLAAVAVLAVALPRMAARPVSRR